MARDVTLTALVEYTAWERETWHEWLRSQGEAALEMSAGPHGDGRFAQVGELVQHIFGAEKRYVERLSGRPLTDNAAIPKSSIDALFQFGRQSRKDLTEFLEALPAEKWDVPQGFNILSHSITATPRKIVIHVLMHEIRHWAQIATLLRVNGLKVQFHDFLFSPVLGAVQTK